MINRSHRSQRLFVWLPLVLLLITILLLSACAQEDPTPEPTATAVANIAPTATEPPPTATEKPTDTPLPEPTATSPPTATPTEAPTDTPEPTPVVLPTREQRITDDFGTEMILVPGGFFPMGTSIDLLLSECELLSPVGCPESAFAAAAPEHTIILSEFYIDAYEVQQEDFMTFLNELGRHRRACLGNDCLNLEESLVEFDGERYRVPAVLRDHPAHSVTWFGASAFCEWRGARLPTEAEWEVAASWDPDNSVKSFYPWGDTFDGTIVNFCDESCEEEQANADFNDGFPKTSPVGSYPDGRSPIGVYDMAGNVWEWVYDIFHPDYYQFADTVNPTGPSNGLGRGVRGGSWFDTGNFTNAFFRAGITPTLSDETIGFRCARSIE